MSDFIPFSITTDAGKKLWREMNQHHGSVVWGAVGVGIEAVEDEMRERIIALLEAGMKDNPFMGGIAIAIALIKGEEK